ncbi:Mitochondrial ribonuclease P protein 1 like [Pseudolycoriella hygida]|uniref:RNA (guanine-9-)-methyltransferase domain-containing protein 1 n=1 Tax=Pseudolycoriella hygida TaxID=35572 RepID=A0A9Q0NCK7_9DIPT|nr:Mitochondrial ribonuclease P protein 1 like [Pseudolycoriella hygida]
MILSKSFSVLYKSFCSSLRLATLKVSSVFQSVNSRYSTGLTKLHDEPGTNNPMDDEEDKKMKLIKLEMSRIHQRGGRAPDFDFVKKYQWDQVITLESTSARRKFYAYLFASQKRRENKVLKQQMNRKAREAGSCELSKKHINYSLGHTTFFLRIGRSTVNLFRNNRLRQAMKFGEKLIFDCSYDDHMTLKEAKNAAEQLALSFATNRKNREPFDLHFCNVNFNSQTMQHLERIFPGVRSEKLPLNLHEGSYLELFPHSQLVYLTPHCKEELTEYDPNKIYIIGAMVDKSNADPLSLAKAKKFNLEVARLPLEKYFQWSDGSRKALTLNQMTNIMLDLKKTQNFEIALQHVPKRKIRR